MRQGCMALFQETRTERRYKTLDGYKGLAKLFIQKKFAHHKDILLAFQSPEQTMNSPWATSSVCCQREASISKADEDKYHYKKTRNR